MHCPVQYLAVANGPGPEGSLTDISQIGLERTVEKKEKSVMMDPKMMMDVPPQVREFAEKSVDQAEKAVSSFMESASKSVAMVPGPMAEVAKQTLAITEANMKAQFECARKLMHAKTIIEVMEIQSEIVRKQFAAASDQFNQMTSGVSSAAKEVANVEIKT